MVETEREIMDTVRSRQKWHDSLLRITLEGQIQKAYGRPRTMLLDRLLKTKEGIGYTNKDDDDDDDDDDDEY